MRFGRKTSFAAGVLTALVLGSGTAYAATGGNFILGKANSAGATTTLTNPNGTAAQFNSKAGTPSVRVNTNVKVPNLNSDLLDGMDQSRFALATGSVGHIYANGTAVDYNSDGSTDYVVAKAQCPAGTRLTGGGFGDGTADGVVFFNAAESTNTWAVYVDTVGYGHDVQAYAQCFNPRGGVTSNYGRAATTSSIDTMLAKRFN